jgi:hypothetical protein
MAWACIIGKMGVAMRDNIAKIKSMDLEFMLGQIT